MPQASSVYQSLPFPQSKLFFYALIILLPFNINRAYFTETSFFYKYHIFYHTVFIYLTDLVIFGLIVSWFVVSVKQTGFKQLIHNIFTSISQKRIYQGLVLFWLILAISTIVSRETWLSLYGLLKISEFLLVFLYVKSNLASPPPLSSPLKGEEFPSLEGRGWGRVFVSHETTLWLIVVGAIIQSGIGILQYLDQHSLGLQRLGESLLIPGMTGIAEFYSGGNAVIRAYGTFPHPNLLGAFLFVGLLASISLIYAQNRQEGSVSREIFLALSLILISTGLTLTFSRTVWAATALVLAALFIASRFYKRRVFDRMQSGQRAPGQENYRPARILAIALLLAVAFCLNWFLFGNQIKDRLNVSRETPFAEQESIVDRKHFASVSREMIKDNPIFGVGLRNFVARMDEYNLGKRLLPHQHQPVHNIYLLLLAEAGVLGLLAFFYLIYNILRRAWNRGNWGDRGAEKLIMLVVFCGFLFLGFFDHYFLSLQQGSLLFWIVAGMVAGKNNYVYS